MKMQKEVTVTVKIKAEVASQVLYTDLGGQGRDKSRTSYNIENNYS